MQKYIVLSVNENSEYQYYLPLTLWAWKKFGWQPIVFYTNVRSVDLPANIPPHIGMNVMPIPGYRSDTVAQLSRLYAGGINFLDSDSLIMTGDIDMIPLSDYWNPNPDEITVYGHDLTGFQHYPICYIAMNKQNWIQVMGLSGGFQEMLERDIATLPQAKATSEPIKRWVADQDLITERLEATTFEKRKVHRGLYPNGYPVGRVDRSAWTLTHPQYIDAHLFREMWKPDNSRLVELTMELLHCVWPNENFEWFVDYNNKYYDERR